MLKQFKKNNVFIIIIVIFVISSLSVTPINNIIQRKYEIQFNKIVLDVISEKLGNMNFNIRDEAGTYFVEFRETELKTEYKEIMKFTKGEAKVSYVFKHSELGTESDKLQIEIPIKRDIINDEFSIENHNKYGEVEIRTRILESFLEYKFDEFHGTVEHEDCEGETEIVSEVAYDYSDMHYDIFGMIIDGINIRFNAKKMNVLCGMTFSGEYNKSLNGEKDIINIEIKEYAGKVGPLWSVNYENVKEVKVFEDGKYEHTIKDKGMMQRIFSLINEFKYEQISSEKMRSITKDNHYSLGFNDGIFDYFVVVGGKGIVIINDRNAASQEASQDLEFFLKMEI